MPKAERSRGAAEKKAVHPLSRKAAYLARAAAKHERKEKVKGDRARKLNLIREKLLWFQRETDAEKSRYSPSEACDVVERYLRRFEAELEQIELVKGIRGRQGSQHSSREAVIRHTAERELELYRATGIEIPDILDPQHLQTFRGWSGDLRQLPNIRMTRVSVKSREERAAPGPTADQTPS